MEPGKVLLIYDSIEYFRSLIEERGIKCYSSFKSVNFLEKVLRKFSLRVGLMKKIWYGDWKHYLSTVDTIVIFATNRFDYIQFIADKYPTKRIIVWYWNPVFRCFEPSKVNGENLEFWSFDKKDCEKYNLRFNSTFYFKDVKITREEVIWDLVFLGADKGRKKAILDVNDKLMKNGLNTNFIIIPNKGDPNPENLKAVSYKDYVELVGESKGIFDFIQSGQSGLTLRPMESIFFDKKLITNDESIINEPFYNADNIFVLGKDNLESVGDFINSSYKKLPNSILEYYEFSNWLLRFGRL